MDRYIGLKIVDAEPMPSVNTAEPGYVIVYKDGYQSWTPEKAFEAYRKISDGVPFSIALESMKRGGTRWRRHDPCGDEWIAIQRPDEHSKIGYSYIYLNKVHGARLPWNPSDSDLIEDDWFEVT